MSTPETVFSEMASSLVCAAGSNSSRSTSEPAIIQAIWTNETMEEFTAGSMNKLHAKGRFNYPEGTIVLCINTDTRVIFGIATIAGKCEERCLLEPDLYTGDAAKYNRFECDIVFRKFMAPISIGLVARMCGWEPSSTHRMAWFLHLSVKGCFLSGKRVDSTIKHAFTTALSIRGSNLRSSPYKNQKNTKIFGFFLNLNSKQLTQASSTLFIDSSMVILDARSFIRLSRAEMHISCVDGCAKDMSQPRSLAIR